MVFSQCVTNLAWVTNTDHNDLFLSLTPRKLKKRADTEASMLLQSEVQIPALTSIFAHFHHTDASEGVYGGSTS